MRKKLLSNWWLKLFSVVLAFGLWWVVTYYFDDPMREKNFMYVPVELLNADILEEEGKVYEVLENSAEVRRVTVRAPKSVIDNLNSSDLVATADFNELTLIQTIEIKFNLPQVDSKSIESIVSSSELVKLNIENKDEKYLVIEKNIIGEVAEGYELSSVTLDKNQNRIKISGPESKIAAVYSASVDVNVEGISQAVGNTEVINLYDAEGNLIEDSSIKQDLKNVFVSVNVLPFKTVPIRYGDIIGTPAPGFMVTGNVELSPEYVELAGNATALADFNAIVLPEEIMDVTGMSENVVREVNIEDYLPERVQLSTGESDGILRIEIHIAPEIERTISIPADNIRIVNIPEGYTVEITDEVTSYEMMIKGLESRVGEVRGNTLQGTVDIGEWQSSTERNEIMEGTYYIPVDFLLGEDIQVSKSVSVRVTITPVEE